MRLSHRDVDLLQTTILELHSLRESTTFLNAAPHLFQSAIPSDWLAMTDVEVDLPGKRVTMFECWEHSKLMTSELQGRLERAAVDHPFSKYSFETGDHTALKFSDFFSMAQLRRSELYNETYRHAGIGRFLATACFNPRGVTTINAGRPIHARDFTERDRRIMNVLRPHYEIARWAAQRNGARAGARPLASYELTPREREVAKWLAEGKTNPEIALILSSSSRTVEKHVEHILTKLGVESRTGAALLLAKIMDE